MNSAWRAVAVPAGGRASLWMNGPPRAGVAPGGPGPRFSPAAARLSSALGRQRTFLGGNQPLLGAVGTAPGLSRAQVPARSRAAGWSVQPPLRTASVTCADSWGPGSCRCHGSWGVSGIWSEERPDRGGAASWEAGLDGRLGRRLQTEAAESLVPLRGAALGGRSCFQPACSVFAAWRRHSLSPASSGSVNSLFAPRRPSPLGPLGFLCSLTGTPEWSLPWVAA